jgi:hypothetical protein
MKYYVDLFFVKDAKMPFHQKALHTTLMVLVTPLIPFILIYVYLQSYFDTNSYRRKQKIVLSKNSSSFKKFKIHFMNANGNYDAKYSILSQGTLEDVVFKGRWYSCFCRHLDSIPYWVTDIGVYTLDGEKIAVFPIYTNQKRNIFITENLRENKRIKYICEVDRKQIYLDNRNAKRLFN